MANNKKPATKSKQKAAIVGSNWQTPVIIIFAFVFLLASIVLLVSYFTGDNGLKTNGLLASAPADQDLVIPLSQLSADASFYSIDIDGTRLEVVAVKAPDNSIRTAFNTCQVCYDSGMGYYVQEGEYLVCQNCGNHFAMSQVEVESGGCNPWPIFDGNKTVTDESITISYDYLREAKALFANWKVAY